MKETREIGGFSEVPAERRHYLRKKVDFQANIVGTDGMLMEEFSSGRVVNISKEGLCLETTFLAEVKALLSLVIYFEGRDSLCLAQIVWKSINQNEARYGLRIQHWTFLDPSLELEMARSRDVPNPAPRLSPMMPALSAA